MSALVYNHFQNNLRLSDVLPIFPFIKSETMRDYYLYTWYTEVVSRVAEKILGALETSGKYLHFIEW